MYILISRPEGCSQPEELWTVAAVCVLQCVLYDRAVDCVVFDYLHVHSNIAIVCGGYVHVQSTCLMRRELFFQQVM